MGTFAEILFYISLFSGGLLILLLLLSLLGGLDLDTDIGTSTDVDTGGLGVIKSGLTFISISAYVAKLMLAASSNPILTVLVALISGLLAVYVLAKFLQVLLRLQSNVNWDFHQAEGKSGKVYLKIPSEGTGIIKVDINGVTRELKARSKTKLEIPTGAEVLILNADEEVAEVVLYEGQ